MKKLVQIALMAALLLPWASKAQNVLTFDFEDNAVPTGWTNTSTQPWVATGTSQGSGHHGNYCLKSGNAGVASSTSTLSATFMFQGEGSISFYAGLWGEGTTTIYDKCIFKIDGEVQFTQGALDTWDTYTYDVEAGSHTFEWSYTKDGTVNPTGDAFFLDDVVVDLGSSDGCNRVTNLTIVDATTSSLTLGWGYPFETSASFTVMSLPDSTILASGLSDNTYTVDDLTANTSYSFAVMADCGNTTSRLSTITSITPRVDPVNELPYFCGFEADDEADWDTCWLMQNGTATNKWYIGTATNNGGTHSLYVSNNNGTGNQYTVGSASDVYAYRSFTLANDGDYALTFDWNAGGEGNYDYLRVYVVPGIPDMDAATISTTDWTQIGDNLNLSNGGWVHEQFTLTEVTTGTYTLIFNWYNDNSQGTQPAAAVDNISLSAITCPQPRALHVDSVSSTTLTVSWRGHEDNSSWIVRINGGEWMNAPDTTYTFDDLNPITAYTVDVAALCGSNDTSFYISVESRTACGVLAELPYSCGFEASEIVSTTNTTALPWCWTRINKLTSGYNYYPYSYNSYVRTGSRAMYFNSSSSSTYSDTTGFVLPALDVDAYPMNENRLVFWAKMTSTTVTKNVLVGTMTDPGDLSTFVAADSVTVSGTTYAKYTVYLTNADATDPYVAVLVPRQPDGTMAIDDLTLEVAPSCIELSSLTAVDSLTTNSTVTLSWIDEHNSGATYNVYRLTATDTVAVETGVNDTTITIEELESNTAYTFGVTVDCGDSESPMTTVSVRTACGIVTLPWSENFDAAITSCWIGANVLASEVFAGASIGTSSSLSTGNWNHTTGQNGFTDPHYYINIYGSSRKGWIVTPAIDLSEAESAELSFDMALTAYSGTMAAPAVYTGGQRFMVIVSTDGGNTWSENNATTWTQSGDTVEHSFTEVPHDRYGRFFVNLNPYLGDTIKIAFYGESIATGGDNDLHIDNISVTAQPSCPRVQGLSLSGIASDGFVLHMADTNGSGNYVIELTDENDSTTTYTTQDTMFAFTELESNMGYSISVWNDCGDGTSTYPIIISTKTLCSEIAHDSLPWSEDFDSYTGSSSGSTTYMMDIDCWNVINRYSYYPYFNNSSTFNPNGGNCIYAYSSTAASPIVVLPAFEDTPAQLMLSLDVRNTSSSYGIEVGVLTNPTDASTFTTVATCVPTATSTWQHFEVTFAGYNDGLLALRNNGANGCYIDNIMVQELPSCVQPSNVTVSDVDTTHATITIADPNETNHYWVILNENDSVEINGNTFTFDTLTASTAYTVSVRTICTDGNVTDATTVNFRTECGFINNLPWVEDFDGFASGTVDLPCWGYIRGHASSGTSQIVAAHPHSGANSLRFSGYAQNKHIRVLPAFADNLSTLMLNMWIYSENRTSSGKLLVGYMTDANDSTTFVATATFDATSTEVNYNQLNNVSARFVNAPANARIAIAQQNSNDNYWWWIDDVTVLVAPSCIEPQAVRVENITTNEADLVVSDTNDNGHYRYYITDGTNYFDTVEFYDTVTTITGLQPATHYTVKVLSVCEDGTVTQFVNADFRTECDPITALPWTEDFEGYTGGTSSSTTSVFNDACWEVYNRYSTNYPYVYVNTSSTYVHGGSKALYLYSSSSSRTMMVLPIFNDPIDGLYLSLWVRAGSTSYGLEFGYVTDASDASTFVATSTWTPAAASTYYEVMASFTGAPEGSRMAIRYNSSSTGSIYIDDITVNSLNICVSSVEARVANITDESAVIEWTAGFGITDDATVTILSETGSVLQTIINAESPLTVDGLNAETSYSAVVTLSCNGDDVASDTVYFSTRCDGGSEIELSATTLNLTSGTSHYLPLCSYFKYSTTEQIFLAEELGGQPMNITSIAFSYTQSTAMTIYTGSIYIKHCTDSLVGTMTVPANDTDMQLVYSGPLNMAQGWNEFVLTNAFAYDGISNIMVAVVASANSDMGSTDRFAVHAVPSGRAKYYQSDSYVYDGTQTATTYAYRNDVKFGTCGDNVGVEEVTVENQVTIYPNPATSSVTVKAEGMREATLIDLNGRMVSTERTNNGTATFDLSTLARGTYFVRVIGEQSVTVRKLIVR